MSSAFSIKLRVAYYRAATFFKTLVRYNLFFVIIFFFKAASFPYIFQRESVVSPLYSKVAVWTLQASLLTETATYTFPKFHNQLFSVTSSFVLKKQISWKITWKLGAKPRKRDDSSAFLHWVPHSIKYLLESNRKNRADHYVYYT